MIHATLRRTACFSMVLLMIATSCDLQKRKYTGGYYVGFQAAKLKSSRPGNDKQTGAQREVSGKEAIHAEERETGLLSAAIEKQNRPMDRSPASTPDHALNRVSSRTSTSARNSFTTKTIKEHQNMTTAINQSEKMHKKKELSDDDKRKQKRRFAIVIGITLLLMALLAAYAAPAISAVFVLGEPVLTGMNVTAAFSGFFAAVIGWIGIFILDILVSLGIYKYYKDRKPKLAIANGALRLVYSAILGIGIAQLLMITPSTSGIAIYHFIRSFNSLWNIGLIIFGLHLIALGILYTNEGGKKWVNLSIKSLLIIAGIGYLVLNTGLLIVPNPAAYTALIQPIFLIPQLLGEVLFAVWMLIKGGKK